MRLAKLIKLIEKNFKLVWKSKLFVLLILLGPLLLTLFLGLAFNNNKDYSIRVGVYSEDYFGVKGSILDNLKNNFIVTRFGKSQDCIDAVKGYETHVCVLMPKEIDLEGNELGEVIFYVDNSRTNLVWIVLDSLSEVLDLSSQQLSSGMTSDLLGRLRIASNKSSQLADLIGTAKEQSETAYLLADDVAQEIALLDLAEMKNDLDKALDLEGDAENLFIKDLTEIKEAATSGKSILISISQTLGNGSIVESEINQLSDKLDEIEESSESGGINDLEELGSLLTETKKDFQKLERTIASAVSKNGEVLALMKKLKNKLILADGLVEEINIAVNNLRVTRVDKIVEPIRTKIEPISTEKTYLGFIFPTLVMLMIVFVSVLLSSSLIVTEKKNRSFFRNWLSKGWGLSFILSYFITDLLIVIVDVFIFILIARFVFDIYVNLLFLVLLFLMAGTFVLLGEIIGLLAKNEQSNILIGVVVSSILVFFSGTLIPVESASGFLGKLIRYNPFVIGERLLRKVLMPGIDSGAWQHDFFIVLAYFFGLILILILVSMATYEKKFEIEDFLKRKIWRKWKK